MFNRTYIKDMAKARLNGGSGNAILVLFLAGLFGGNLLDLAGVPALLGMATLTGGAGMVLFWFFLRPPKQAKGGNA